MDAACDDAATTDSGQWWEDVKENADADDNRSCCKYFAGTSCTDGDYDTQKDKYMCPLVVSPQENFCRHLTDGSMSEVANDCATDGAGGAGACNTLYEIANQTTGEYHLCEIQGGG
jgi:hypothetical protein